MNKTLRMILCLALALILLSGCAGSQPVEKAEPQPRLDVSIGFWNIDRMNDVQQDAMREYM